MTETLGPETLRELARRMRPVLLDETLADEADDHAAAWERERQEGGRE